MKNFIPKPLALAISAQIALTVAGSQAVAQEEPLLEEVVITGSRAAPRSVFDSPAPIDVVSGQDIANQGDTDLSNLLRNVVPSYNVNTQPISDASTVVRPANMRGLAPDHTLVLVNNKRRHRAAVIYWLGNGVSDGAQGADISPIPSIALKQVEVLRDGAAAQYGSDAIAGVMNFILKDDAEGASFEIKYGEFFEGDGQQVTYAGNIGLPLTSDGFANLSFEYGNTDPTDRSVQRDDAAGLIADGNTAVANPAQVWGQPEVFDDLKLMGNFGIDLGDEKQAYAHGNYASKEVEGGFYFRNPDTRGAVFSNDGGATRLVGDLTDDMSGNCPVVNVGDAAGLQSLIDDPDCFAFNELFPGGFTPRFGGKTTDIAGVAGVRGVNLGWNWDVSLGAGRHEADFFIRNTVNASLGPNTPTEFDPGAYTQLDKTLNIDVSKGFDVGFASDLNVAGGFEWRNEQFEITVGDPESFEIGPLAAQGFSAASNGFAGFSNLAGGRWDRTNIAFYADLEANITDAWLVGLALRWEDFNDFGTTTNGKIATNFAITDSVSLRGSYSTGFRAPTPGQSNAFNVSTEFDSVTNDLVNNGFVPPTNPASVLKGGQQLEPEESVNWTAGIILQLGEVAVTIDYFNIELTDRIAPSQNFTLDPGEVQLLIDSGVTSAGNLAAFRFFTNDFDTTTSGFDVVATWGTSMLGGNTDFSLAYNNTETEVDSFSPEIVEETRIKELEEGLPQTRWNVSATHNMDAWRFMLRASYYDEFFDSEDDLTYGDEYIVDAEVAYTFNEKYTVTLGAQNLLDEFPDENPGAAGGVGNQYSQFSPSGFGGGFYYLRLNLDF